MKSTTKFNLALSIILFLNILLKFYGIDKNSLWLDEAYSTNEAQLSIQNIILHSSQSDNPPLYYILLHFWTNIFGFSEMAVRSLSAVFSVMTAVVILIFISRNFNLLVGVFSSLFFTVSNENLLYAQEARTYALVVFLTAISVGLFFELFKKRNILFLAFLTLTNVLLFYSHYISVLIPLMEVCIAVFYFRNNKRFLIDIFVSSLIVFLCFIPWIQYPLSHSPKEGFFWLHKPTFSNFKGILIGFAGNKVTLILCFIIFVYTAIRKILSIKTVGISFSFHETSLLVFSFFPIVFIYLIAGYIPIFLLRYLLFATIPFYILVSLLFDSNIENKRYFIITMYILICSSLVTINLHPSKDENWREAVKKVKELRKDDEYVILSASYTDVVFSYYYDKIIFCKNDIRDSVLMENGIFPINGSVPGALNKFKNKNKLIGVFCHALLEDPGNNVQNELSTNFKKVESYDYEKVKVVVYENLLK